MAPVEDDGAAPLRFEMVEPEMARLLSAMSGPQRLEIACSMFRAARDMLRSELGARHREWSPEQLDAEVARRLALGSG